MNITKHGIPVLLPKRRVRVRQCFKKRHATRDEAFDHLLAHQEELGDDTLKVYRCRWCRDEQGRYGFHIGHPKLEEETP